MYLLLPLTASNKADVYYRPRLLEESGAREALGQWDKCGESLGKRMVHLAVLESDMGSSGTPTHRHTHLLLLPAAIALHKQHGSVHARPQPEILKTWTGTVPLGCPPLNPEPHSRSSTGSFSSSSAPREKPTIGGACRCGLCDVCGGSVLAR
jgi:hypothetical protein